MADSKGTVGVERTTREEHPQEFPKKRQKKSCSREPLDRGTFHLNGPEKKDGLREREKRRGGGKRDT